MKYHGRYCGPNYSSGGRGRTAYGYNLGLDVPPVDDLDDACRNHDKLYEAVPQWPYNAAGEYIADLKFNRDAPPVDWTVKGLKSGGARLLFAAKQIVPRLVGVEPNPGPLKKSVLNKLVRQANTAGLIGDSAIRFISTQYQNLTGEALPSAVFSSLLDNTGHQAGAGGPVASTGANADIPNNFWLPSTNWRYTKLQWTSVQTVPVTTGNIPMDITTMSSSIVGYMIHPLTIAPGGVNNRLQVGEAGTYRLAVNFVCNYIGPASFPPNNDSYMLEVVVNGSVFLVVPLVNPGDATTGGYASSLAVLSPTDTVDFYFTSTVYTNGQRIRIPSYTSFIELERLAPRLI